MPTWSAPHVDPDRDIRQPAEEADKSWWEVDEPCPDCGNDPKDASLHAEGCVRLDSTGQFGPPWDPPPWLPLPVAD
jgi:hypothetical protein